MRRMIQVGICFGCSNDIIHTTAALSLSVAPNSLSAWPILSSRHQTVQNVMYSCFEAANFRLDGPAYWYRLCIGPLHLKLLQPQISQLFLHVTICIHPDWVRKRNGLSCHFCTFLLSGTANLEKSGSQLQNTLQRRKKNFSSGWGLVSLSLRTAVTGPSYSFIFLHPEAVSILAGNVSCDYLHFSKGRWYPQRIPGWQPFYWRW